MARDDYDLFVIGGGSGGVRAARRSAELGARVALAEEKELGGTCVNVGCVPKKLLVYASAYRDHFEDAAAYGWTVGETQPGWPQLIANKNREIERLNGVYRRLLERTGVEIFDARATVTGPRSVAVDGREIRAETILIATGGRPTRPDVPGAELAATSDDVFFLPELPRRVLVVGAGYIGLEFTGVFHGLGCAVTLLYRGTTILRGFDDDVRRTLEEDVRRQGVDVRCETLVDSIERRPDGLRCRLSTGAALDVDLVLCATGRDPNTRGLGLERAGVRLAANGAVVVDELSRTTAPSLWAIGDCTDRLQLTPVAIAEGEAFARTVFGGAPTPADHRNVPSAVFSQPNVAVVGLTEAEARDELTEVDVYRTSFRPMKHTLTGRDERAMMKLVVDRATDRVVGCHMVGPEAAEIIQGLAVALRCGATKAHFDGTLGIHPTTAEEFVTLREKVEPVVGADSAEAAHRATESSC